MKEFDKDHLLKKFHAGVCSEEELHLLNAWYADWNLNDHVRLSESDLDRAEALMRPVVMEHIRAKRNWINLRLAAAAVVLVIMGSLLYRFYPRTLAPNSSFSSSDIEKRISPGSHGATLTLGDGRKIPLDRSGAAALAEQGAVSIRNSADGSLVYELEKKNNKDIPIKSGLTNTLSTANGQTYQLNLPDGTKVWLNAASSISYVADFSAYPSREVQLQGEAYFEVAKDKKHPFVVTASNGPKGSSQKIVVLGTHFNINSYLDEPEIQTTLLEGSIRLSSGSAASDKILKPGQQAGSNALGTVIRTVDAGQFVAWKDNLFYFEKADIKTVMNQFCRWYDVEVEYKGSIPTDRITGKVYRNADLDAALRILKYLDIQYTIKGRKITINQ